MISKPKVLAWFSIYAFIYILGTYKLISPEIILIASALPSLIIVFLYGKSAIVRIIVGLYFSIPLYSIMSISVFANKLKPNEDYFNSFMLIGLSVISVILIAIIIKTIIILVKRQGNITVDVWILVISLLVTLLFYLLFFSSSQIPLLFYLFP